MKPEIKLELISYKPPFDPNGTEYDVFIINGAKEAPYAQGSLICTCCGKRHHFRWNPEGEWVVFKCPHCSTTSAWYEEEQDF